MHSLLRSVTKPTLVFAVGLLALPGCPLLDVAVDAPDVCLTYPNLEVPAGTGAQTSLDQSFVFDDLSKVHDALNNFDANLEFVRADITATSGIDNFKFIHAAHLTVASNDPGATLPPMTMYDCNGDCAGDTDMIEIPAAIGNDAIPYLRGDSVKIDIKFEGTVPSVAWTMDVNVCMNARAGYSYSP